MKLWVDDVRPAPDGYVWYKSVNTVKRKIKEFELTYKPLKLRKIEIIDLDHDAGDFSTDGGDYIEILNWLEETGRSYPIRIHSMNPVGVENMRRIIQKNGWTEVR